MYHFGEHKVVKLGEVSIRLILIDNNMFAVKDEVTGDLLALGIVRCRDSFNWKGCVGSIPHSFKVSEVEDIEMHFIKMFDRREVLRSLKGANNDFRARITVY